MAMIIRIEVPDLISNRAELVGQIITAAERAGARITISGNKVHPDEGNNG